LASKDTNLKGRQKLARLREAYPDLNLEYIGDARADLQIFAAVNKATAVVRSQAFGSAVQKIRPDAQLLPVTDRKWRALSSGLRLKHWSKNLLVFVPLVLAHALKSGLIVRTLWAAVAFSFAASSVYFFNDVLDLHSDRLHAWKSKRPLAAGEMSIPFALGTGVILFALALIIGSVTSGIMCAALLLLYVASSLAYSVKFKQVPVLDVLLLASFYVQRVILGAAVGHIEASNWLLAFCLFFFFSMALAKRYSELLQNVHLVAQGKSGRGYLPEDSGFVRELGLSSGLVSVLVVALYVHGAEATQLYPRASYLWALVPLLLFWVSHIWLLANRGVLNDDPIVLALKDKASIAIGCVAAAVLLISAIH